MVIIPSKSDWQAAFAICAAIIGAGFASGREIVSFFSCFGAASHLGTAAASAGIGALVYVIMLLGARTKARTLPGIYGALMGRACEDAISVLHGLLCLVTASAMLAAGAELGALTFPVQHAYEAGFLLTLFLAVSAACTGFHSLSVMGVLLVPLTASYFLKIAHSGRYYAEFSFESLLPALPMGLIYAAFNGALAGGTICLAAQKGASPGRTGFLAALLMFLLLFCGNWAMLRCGDVVRQMNMPAVALSAQWGSVGYYLSILVLWMAVLSTLGAMLQTLSVRLADMGLGKTPSLLAGSLAPALLAVCGFRALVDAIYPMLGWVCGFALVALLIFLPEEHEQNEIQ